jgi:PIN domain nuclease of toxin-antitoxin system
MRLILDTHLLLWAAAEPDRLPAGARRRIESADNDVLFSAASVWELAIKMDTGRLDVETTLEEIIVAAVDMGFTELPVSATHAAAVRGLPRHHRDPFDRLLVAQATVEPARLLTVDRALVQYSDLVDLL